MTTVQATDISGESAAVSTTVIVTPAAQLIVTLAADTSAAVVAGFGQLVKFTALVTPATGGADVVSKYAWSFNDGASAETNGNLTTHVYRTKGTYKATVTVTTTDGRTATAITEFIAGE